MSLYDFTNNGEPTTIKSEREALTILRAMEEHLRGWMTPEEYDQEVIEVLAYTIPTMTVSGLLSAALDRSEARRAALVPA